MVRIRTLGEALEMAAVLVFAVAISFLAARQLALLQALDNRLADMRIADLSAPEPQHPGIVVVTITEDTLATLHYRSPLDRGFLAGVLTALDARGVKAIGLDILFDQRTDGGAKDKGLKAVLTGLGVPVIAAWADKRDGLTDKQQAYLSDYLGTVARGYAGLRTDIRDGTMRWVDAGAGVDGVETPGLAAAVAEAVGADVPKGVMTLAYRTPPDRETTPFRIFPAHLVKVLPKVLHAGKIVMVGADLPLVDRFPTPMSVGRGGETVPGVIIHAHALAQILDRRSAPSPDLTFEIVLVVGLAMLGLLIAGADLAIPAKTGAVAVLLAGLWVGAWSLYAYAGILVGLMAPSLALVLAGGVGTAYLGRRERQQKRYLRQAFSRYISPGIVEQLAADPSRLSLGGERREVTFIFTDIASFTSLMEQSEPSVILPVLNEYLDGMCRIVLESEGTMDKIVGDAVVSFFGAPSDQPDHAALAVHCALKLDAFASQYAKEQQARGIDFGITRIGVNTGMAAVGNFGGDAFFNYTAHGDAVNTAARMESVNKHLGTNICVAGVTASRCTDVQFRPVGNLVLKGKQEGVEAFEPLSDAAAEAPQTAAYREAFALMAAEDPSAPDVFARLLQTYPDDKLIALHAERLADGDQGSTIILKEK